MKRFAQVLAGRPCCRSRRRAVVTVKAPRRGAAALRGDDGDEEGHRDHALLRVPDSRASARRGPRALERGYLRDIFIDEGQSVRRGQSLFHGAHALSGRARAQLGRGAAPPRSGSPEHPDAREGNVVSPNELALAQATLNQVTAQRRSPRRTCAFSRIEPLGTSTASSGA